MQKYSGLLWRMFWQGCQNCIHQFQQNILREILHFEKKIVFFSFSGIGRKMFRLCAKFLGKRFLNCLLGGQKNILRKSFLLKLKFSIIFAHWSIVLKIFVDFFLSLRLSSLHSMLPEELFEENTFFEKRHFISFGQWAKKVPFFPFIGELVRTAFCMSRGTFWARECSFFSVVDQKCSSLLAEKLQKICRKCIVPVQKKFSEEFFGKKNWKFCTTSEIFWSLREIFSTGLSKLLSSIAAEKIDEI